MEYTIISNNDKRIPQKQMTELDDGHIGTYVIKRDGRKEAVDFNKITKRIRQLTFDVDVEYCDPIVVAQDVIHKLVSGIHTHELDVLAAEVAAYRATDHPDYSILAGHILASNLQKRTPDTFAEAVRILRQGDHPLLSEDIERIVKSNGAVIEAAINHDRDFLFDFFGFRTLERSYLLRTENGIVERPQYMWMRVALQIHGDDIESALETYELLSTKTFTHATPTLFNSGTLLPQLSSCYLVHTKGDTTDGIYDTLKQCAMLSKHSGGIGLSVHEIRARGSLIQSTRGKASGLVPMLRMFDASSRYVDQGGRRPGSIAVYLEPWHADIEDFLELKKGQGKEEMRARDLFYALWIPDLFMRRLHAGEPWTLFSPSEAPGLHELHGVAFDELYEKYEAAGRGRRQVDSRKLWSAVIVSQIETGGPFILFKDACNAKSNQCNLGTITSSNLCCEIIQYSSPEETAVCTLASINLTAFVHGYGTKSATFDFDRLRAVTRVVTRNLNRIVDIGYYPRPEARLSAERHRAIGIGVQGLASTFMAMRLPFESTEARQLNRDIFESMYFAALDASIELAAQPGSGPYPSYRDSPLNKGLLQFDLWKAVHGDDVPGPNPALGLDWTGLRERLAQHGARNSLLLALMPTASTSQILGPSEGCDAITSNIYARRVLAGEFPVVNRYMVRDLVALGLWSKKLKDDIVVAKGSIQDIPGIPDEIKQLYKTVWEIKQRSVIDMAADRGAFICQSQSMNLHLADATEGKVGAMLKYAWSKGLKTGCYYLRTRPKASPLQFSLSADRHGYTATEKDDIECESCSA